jgi:hypothetical protein
LLLCLAIRFTTIYQDSLLRVCNLEQAKAAHLEVILQATLARQTCGQ